MYFHVGDLRTEARVNVAGKQHEHFNVAVHAWEDSLSCYLGVEPPVILDSVDKGKVVASEGTPKGYPWSSWLSSSKFYLMVTFFGFFQGLFICYIKFSVNRGPRPLFFWTITWSKSWFPLLGKLYLSLCILKLSQRHRIMLILKLMRVW